MNTKDKFTYIISSLEKDENNIYTIWSDILESYSEDADYMILTKKINNFLNIMNTDPITDIDSLYKKL